MQLSQLKEFEDGISSLCHEVRLSFYSALGLFRNPEAWVNRHYEWKREVAMDSISDAYDSPWNGPGEEDEETNEIPPPLPRPGWLIGYWEFY